MASITTEVEVYLDEFDDAELVDELENRGYCVGKGPVDFLSVNTLFDAWVLDKNKFEDLFREFCRQNIGRSF